MGFQPRVQAGDQVNAGLDHRRRVQVGGYWRGGGHGLGQPEMKRHVGALREGPDQHQDQGGRHQSAGSDAELIKFWNDKRPGVEADHEQSGQQTQSPHRRDDQGVQGPAFGFVRPEVDPDQQEGGHAGHLPEHQQGDEIPGQDNPQHRSHEQQKGKPEHDVNSLVVEVPHGVQADKRSDARNQEGEHLSQPVDVEDEGKIQAGKPAYGKSEGLPVVDRTAPDQDQQKGPGREGRGGEPPGVMVDPAEDEH